MKIYVPPIKSQGIKTKLVPWIKECIDWNGEGRWVEPFVGTGVVGFNVAPEHGLFCDGNPHIINFYREVNAGKITPRIVREFLEDRGNKLSQRGEEYYYEVRDIFNGQKEPLDFLFLNRCCFNGIIRFNRKGEFNVPFGHKPDRFSKSYITKIVNQVDYVYRLARVSDWEFRHQGFRDTFTEITAMDFMYCDPPYVGRHVDYFNGWDDQNERHLFQLLTECPCNFILSTWHSNQHRKNHFIDLLWSNFTILTKEHFYHVGAKETNRKPMLEALVLNYTPSLSETETALKEEQLTLFEL